VSVCNFIEMQLYLVELLLQCMWNTGMMLSS